MSDEKREKFRNLDLTPLDTYTIDKVAASIVFDTRREKDNGYYPVKIRVTYLKRQVYYPCMDMTACEYSNLHKAVRNPNLIKTKKLIQAMFKRITGIIEELVTRDGFSFEMLNMRLKRGVEDSILTAFDNRITELEEKSKIGTAQWYACAKNSILKFTGKDVKFSTVTPAWLEKYEAQMLKEGKEYTTISINLRALRAVINGGLREGIISQSQYPFVVKRNGKYRIPEAKGRKIALNSDQILKVFNYPILPDQEKWRDLWIFSFYCNGANISDILRFKFENITGNCIEWYRKKTISTDLEKSKIRAIVTEEMEEIITKWGNPDKSPENYVFPFLTSDLTAVEERKMVQNIIHSINKVMKKIGKGLGYGDVTSYWSRHSFASISRSEGVSLFGISKSLGHKNLTTTQIYLDSLSDDELINNASKLPRRASNGKN